MKVVRRASGPARPVLVRIHAAVTDVRSVVSVELATPNRSIGEADGTSGSAWRVAAQATLDALREPLEGIDIAVHNAGVIGAAGRQIGLVILTVTDADGSVTLTGSASAPWDPYDAIARATLDALNRIPDRAARGRA